jgi:flavin-dependent dehydrogenase
MIQAAITLLKESARSPFPKEELRFVHLDFGRVPNGYGWVFPKKEWLSIGIGGMFRESKKTNPRKYFNTFLKGLAYLDEGKMERIAGHLLSPFYNENQKVSQGRILLVGDAAHLMDPLMGEGIYYALRSGILASEAIIQGEEKEIPPCDLYQNA